MADYSEAEAKALHCWSSVDRVARDAETTAWKRSARLRQARWREARGFPIGMHPHAGGVTAKPVGSLSGSNPPDGSPLATDSRPKSRNSESARSDLFRCMLNSRSVRHGN